MTGVPCAPVPPATLLVVGGHTRAVGKTSVLIAASLLAWLIAPIGTALRVLSRSDI